MAKKSVQMSESVILDVMNMIGLPKSASTSNSSNNYIPIDCPFCGNDTKGHGGIKKTTGSYSCWKDASHSKKNLFLLVSELRGAEEAKRVFHAVGLFQSPAKESIKVDRVSVPGIEMIRPPEPILLNLLGGIAEPNNVVVNQGSDHTHVPNGALSALNSKECLEYLTNSRYVKTDGVGKYTVQQAKYIMEKFKLLYFPSPMYDSVLRHPEAKTDRIRGYENRIVVPVYINGELHSYSGRDMSNNPKALRYKACNAQHCITPTQKSIFPFDELVKVANGKILLVQEGAFDIFPFWLYARYTGVYSVCVFTHNIVKEQLELLIKVATKFEKVVLLLDKGENAQISKVALTLRRLLNFVGVVTGEELESIDSLTLPNGYKDTDNIEKHQIPIVTDYISHKFKETNNV